LACARRQRIAAGRPTCTSRPIGTPYAEESPRDARPRSRRLCEQPQAGYAAAPARGGRRPDRGSRGPQAGPRGARSGVNQARALNLTPRGMRESFGGVPEGRRVLRSLDTTRSGARPTAKARPPRARRGARRRRR
jgi:hypothetical protein